MEKIKQMEEAEKQALASVRTPHDKGYKKSLSRPGEFLHFLKKYVKADWMMGLAGAIRAAYGRIRELGLQEGEEFRNWVKYVLLSVSKNKEAVINEILSWAGNGEDDMAFEYNIVRVLREEREKEKAEGKAEGKAEDILELLLDIGSVTDALRDRIFSQKDLDVLRKWHKLAARAQSVEEFERQSLIFD